jgi:sugar O-acyltransferase (sialic acid O-acetyltransferase NeuD family)
MRRLYLCGAGNPEGVRLAIRVNERTHRWDSIVLLDDDPAKHGSAPMSVPILGPFAMLADADPRTDETVNLITRTTARRRVARDRLLVHGIPFAPLVSCDVDLLGATVGADLIAYQHATIGPEVVIGTGSVVFMSATVGHECQVGQDCIVAANAVLNARVRLGDGVYVGSNAVVLPEITVGADATIGAGAVVIDDVPAGATLVSGLGDLLPGRHAGAGTTDAIVPATSDLGPTLHRLWCEALGLAESTDTRNFFELGGTSLAALRLARRIEAATGRTLCAVDLFHHPTLEALEAHLRAEPTAEARRAMTPALRRADLRRAFLQRPVRAVEPSDS